ncbi:MAG: hypothetical protein GXO04_03930, partial [Aquificae bacterium]|nr:hypothetical protein [Aquificota bacterium]
MKEALILLFLIVSYNYILYYITAEGLSAVPLFPKDPVHVIIVLSFNLVLYIGWFFGERRRLVTLLGYLFFVQIALLSLIQKDPYVFVSDAVPVVFTLMLVALFESPFEKEKKRLEEERKKLLFELEKNLRKREEIEEKIDEYKRAISVLRFELERKEESLKRAKALEEDAKKVEQREREVNALKKKLSELETELRKQREKEARLLDANRQLFQLLELLGKEEDKKRGTREVKELRKERKKLIKEVLELQKLLEVYDKENKELRLRLEELNREKEKLTKELEEARESARRAKSAEEKRTDVYREVLRAILPHVDFSKEAVREFGELDNARKRALIRELERLKDGKKPESLASDKDIYKLKFSGGRAYLGKKNERWVVIGILDSEDDKDKARFIEGLRGR